MAAETFETIRADIATKAELLYGSRGRAAVLRSLASDGSTAVIFFRLSELAYASSLAPIGFALAKTNKVLNGVVIGRGAKIGAGFVLQHPVGIVINGTVQIGERCVLQSGVTLGAHSIEDRSTPTVGDGCSIGSGAKLIGGISIGSGVSIGANAVVITDLPDGVTAVGVPARIL